MFSLKFDLLFPTIASAKELAREFNLRRKAGPAPPDGPREIQRIRAELRLAREKQRSQALAHRYHVF